MGNVLCGHGTALQRGEHIELHARQHRKSGMSRKYYLVDCLGSKDWTFHSVTSLLLHLNEHVRSARRNFEISDCESGKQRVITIFCRHEALAQIGSLENSVNYSVNT